MENRKNTLCEVPVLQECTIEGVGGEGEKRLRLLQLGFFQGSRVKPLYTLAKGRTRIYWVKSTLIALRKEDAMKILVQGVAQDGN